MAPRVRRFYVVKMTGIHAPKGRSPSTSATRVVLVHPSGLFTEMLAATLARSERIDLLGTYASAGEACADLDRLRPDIVVAGRLRREELRACVSAADDCGEGVPVLVVADEGDPNAFPTAMDAGVSGFITSACSATQFIDAVERVAHGEIVVLAVGGRRLARKSERPEDALALYELTPRQQEILRLICSGRSNSQIAKELFISGNTVRTHIQNIRAKLKVSSKLEAALIALGGGPGRVENGNGNGNGNGNSHHRVPMRGGERSAPMLPPAVAAGRA